MSIWKHTTQNITQHLIKSCCAATVALFISAASLQTASAAVVTYSDEATWQTAINGLGGFTQFNFDNFTLDDPGTVLGQPHKTLTTQIPGITFSNAEIIPSCCAGSNQSAPNIVLNFPNSTVVGDIEIVFNSPVFGVGIFNSSVVDDVTFKIFDSSNVLISSLLAPIGSVNFVGFTVDVAMAIKKLVATPGPAVSGSIFIDDLQVGPTVSAVPLPAALPLFGSGLAVMGLIGWRRKRKIAAAA